MGNLRIAKTEEFDKVFFVLETVFRRMNTEHTKTKKPYWITQSTPYM